MPTNLPPEYFEIEKRYRAARSTAEKITLLQELLSVVPKHKGTDKLRADLRRRLSRLETAPKGRKGVSRRESAFHVDREGAGQVVLVGPANVGKSALLAALTNAAPDVGPAPYTTWAPTPGMMPVENVQVQLIDTPSLNRDFVEPEFVELLRHADLVLLVIDLQAYPLQQLEDTVALLHEQRIVPRHLRDRYGDEAGLAFVLLLVVVNKNDDERSDEDLEVLRELLGDEWPLLPVSAATGRHLDLLKRAVFERLDVVRVYPRPPGREPDWDEPFVLQRGATVEELAAKIHQDFYERLKSARVWGSAEYEGQMVGRDYVLQDGDVVELRI